MSGNATSLQTRAYFLKEWGWELVTDINKRTCQRGGAQHGVNPETHDQVKARWEAFSSQESTLEETFLFLKECHRSAPFLNFNGNVFAGFASTLSDVVFREVPQLKRQEIRSAVGHVVAGKITVQEMRTITKAMEQATELKPGDSVKSLAGSMRGKVTKLLPDGRVEFQTPQGMKALGDPDTLIKTSNRLKM